MRAFFTIILLMIAATGFCQREYTHENKGFNMFLEAEGNGNLDWGMGGPSLTVGYQFNPHFFWGIGISNKYGAERSLNRDDVRPLGWYDATTGTYHDDYYIDEKGERRKIYDNSNGDAIDLGGGYYIDTEWNCEECEGVDAFLDIYADVRYNFLAQSRYTPYLNYRTGATFSSFHTAGFNELIMGCRFGLGEGDFAIVFGSGWTYRNFHDDDLKSQSLFTLKLGVEF